MQTGMSSACFYPLETEKSVRLCGEMGFKNIEIFVNAPCELKGRLLDEIKSEVSYYGLNVVSVHPFTSFAESFTLFGSYKRRTDDTVELYKHFFQFANEMNSGIFVLHGAKTMHTADGEDYFERFARLRDTGKEFGITVSQENVVDFRSQSVDFIKRMNAYLNGDFAMTLDLKQCRRAGESPLDFIKTVGEKTVNVHISDYNSFSDCLPPFEGKEDFSSIVKALKEKEYKGKYLIELYSNCFTDKQQIINAAEKFDKIIG